MLLALTGNIGAGKSTVAKFIESLGYRVVDLDTQAKEILLTDENVRMEVVEAFGKGVVDKWGRIDTRKLAERVFSSRQELKRLTTIIHPRLVGFLESLKAECITELVFVEVAVVFEYGWECFFDAIVLVYAHRGQRLLRASKRFGLREAIRRESFQLPYRKKIGKSDYLICNTGDMLHLKNQVLSMLSYLEGT